MPDSLSARVRAACLAVAAVFLVNGIIMATWVSRIPAIKHHLGLTEGQLGLALLGIAVGALLSFPMAGPLIARFGSHSVTVLAGLALCATLPLIPSASSLGTLTAVLAVLGACNGTMDVAMNANGVEVEQRYHRPVMSSFHGMFSLGGCSARAWGAGWRDERCRQPCTLAASPASSRCCCCGLPHTCCVQRHAGNTAAPFSPGRHARSWAWA